METTATLLLYCKDRKGLVLGIAQFILEHGGNILHADQHQDATLGIFFMRIQWSLSGFDLDQETFPGAFAPLAEQVWIYLAGSDGPAAPPRRHLCLALSTLPNRSSLPPSGRGVALPSGPGDQQSRGRS